jgi:hypothetical protein
VPLYLGSIIAHKEVKKGEEIYNLVDGQQRSLTLLLVLKVLYEKIAKERPLNDGMKTLLQGKFAHSLSQQCIAENYRRIKAHFSVLTNHEAESILKKLNKNLEFVLITIQSIDQAFTFFDSQNTAGKRASEFDLLKARHLRGVISIGQVDVGCAHVWEEYETIKLNGRYGHSLAYYLSRELVAASRFRARGKRAATLHMAKEFPVMTTGQTGGGVQLSPYGSSPLLGRWKVGYDELMEKRFTFTQVVDLGLSGKIEHKVDDVAQLPLQWNQLLEGGEQFFFFISKYASFYQQLFAIDFFASDKDINITSLSLCERLLFQHKELEYLQGIGYPRLVQVWQSLVIFYVDRFGCDQNFEDFVKLADQYVFSLQLSLQPLRRDSIEKFLHEECRIFSRLLDFPVSIEALQYIKQLINEQAKNQKLITNITEVKKGSLISNYLKRFYSQNSKNNDGHCDRENSLSTLIKESCSFIREKSND